MFYNVTNGAALAAIVAAKAAPTTLYSEDMQHGIEAGTGQLIIAGLLVGL